MALCKFTQLPTLALHPQDSITATKNCMACCSYPVHVWHDAHDGITRMDTYSINTLITSKVGGRSSQIRVYYQYRHTF